VAEEAPEPQYEEKMVPHSYPLKAKEELVGVRRLSKDATKEAKARIKDLEKRDNDKYKTDEAKNDFESIIYEFKDFLYDDENSYYETETEIEALLEACSEARDWLDDAGAEVGYKTFQTKTYELQSKYSKLKNRKTEHKMREEYLEAIFGRLKQMKDEIPAILENKPWISEDEARDVTDKIDETTTWLSEKVEAQNEVGLAADPAFSMDSVQPKIEKV
jgi:hypoxia up-regulated 1